MNICGPCKGDYIALKSTEAYEQNAKAVVEYGFGGLKIDGCTGNHNSTLWGELLAATGKPILTENHANEMPHPVDATTPCPYNFYRWGGVGSSYFSGPANSRSLM